MSHRTLIVGGRVVFPTGVAETGLLLCDGKIAAVDASATTTADEVIDASGLFVLPGMIDDQVHFREPGLTHKEDLATASSAAVAGGVTSYLEMPNTSPAATTVEILEAKYRLAASKSVANYGFYIGATGSNVAELNKAENIPGIKIFIGSSTGDLLVDEQEALEQIFAQTTLPICAHCEDESTVQLNRLRLKNFPGVAAHSQVRDVAAAVLGTRRAVDLAVRHSHRFHVLHVSAADELPIIAAAQGIVTAEICPHHLLFSTEDYSRLGTRIQMNPAIKPPHHQTPLWQALADDTIQVIATDHAPHTLEEKSQAYPASPSGMPAVENYLALMTYYGRQQGIDLPRIAAAGSDAPARIWGLVGKGRIAVGYDADIVLFDPHLTRTIRDEDQWSKCRWSAWSGESITGWPVRTIIAGRTVFRRDGNGRGVVDANVQGTRLRCDRARGGYWATSDGVGL